MRNNKTQADLNLHLLDVIKEQNKTIDKLTSKLMARNLPEYRAEDTSPNPANRLKEDPTMHFMDAPGQDILNSEDE